MRQEVQSAMQSEVRLLTTVMLVLAFSGCAASKPSMVVARLESFDGERGFAPLARVGKITGSHAQALRTEIDSLPSQSRRVVAWDQVLYLIFPRPDGSIAESFELVGDSIRPVEIESVGNRMMLRTDKKTVVIPLRKIRPGLRSEVMAAVK